VENAFKHISHKTNKVNFVNVQLSKNNGYFQFVVENSKDNSSVTTEKHGGIGLQNVKRRLELLYPGKHLLDIQNTTDTYKVDFKLKI
jgi:LytS/YehU family sensor histidine kinase